MNVLLRLLLCVFPIAGIAAFECSIWDTYITELVELSRGTCLKATIIGLNGSTWSSDTHNNALKLNETEKEKIGESFTSENFDDFKANGITVEGKMYTFIKLEGDMLVRGMNEEDGLVILHATNATVVIAISTNGPQNNELLQAVAVIANKIIDRGY